MKFLKVESYKKGIVLSTVFNFFNKGLVFINSLVVTFYFGVHAQTDIFFYLYNSITLLSGFIMNFNSSVIIPESMKLRIAEGEEKAMKFLNTFIFGYFSLFFILIVLIALNPVFFFSMISNFKEGQLQSNLSLLYLGLPLFLLVCVIGLCSDILASYKFFTISMIVGIINGSLSILFVFLFHNSFHIKSIFYGLLFSYSFNIILLFVLMQRNLKWKFSIGITTIPKRVWKNIGFAQLGNLTSMVSSYTPMYILSGFSTGIITALTFAQQISALPNALITNQFSSVAGIKFNELYARGMNDEINRIFVDVADLLLFLMVPMGFYIYLFSGDIISIVLAHSSLNTEGVYYASLFLKYLGLLLPLLVINTLFARIFMASHKIKEAFWCQIVLNVALIAGLYFSVKAFGIIGYPITMIAIYILNALVCYFLEKYYFNFIQYDAILKKFATVILVNLLISVIVFYIMHAVNISRPFPDVVISFLAYAILLYGVNAVFNINRFVNTQILDIYRKAGGQDFSNRQ